LSACGMGSFSAGARPIALLLRRVLLTVHMPSAWLMPLSVLLPESSVDAFARFVQTYAYWSGVRRGLRSRRLWRGLVHGPRILMYHAIAADSEPPSCYVVSQRSFERQLRYLEWRGFRVLPLADLVAHLRQGTVPPPHSVVLTFDDGFADNAVCALPVLQRYRFPATVFVVSDGIGQCAWWPQDEALQGRPMISSEQLSALHRAGVEIGAHTRSHPSLAHILRGLMTPEIAGARTQLEERIGAPVRSFAYPFGDLSSAACDEVERAGYDAACCSRSGVVDPSAPLFALPRIEVRGTDSLLEFALMLWRGHRRGPGRGRPSLQRVPA
jgi:peptidoglycan/xylan/chitin deacetylase (PgdA/CDA1 family)